MKRNNNTWKALMFAIVKSAYVSKDFSFFISDWGKTLCEETDVRILEKFNKKYEKQIRHFEDFYAPIKY